jgi:hypothetical protein
MRSGPSSRTIAAGSRGVTYWARRRCALAAAACGIFLVGCPPVTGGEDAGAGLPAGVAATTIELGPLRVVGRAGGIVAADLTGDGRRELIVTTPGAIGAYCVEKGRLWSAYLPIQVTGQAEREGLPGNHAPGIAVADLGDGGGASLLYLDRTSRLIALDGATGRETAAVHVPPPDGAERWEHLAVANFRGEGLRDILLQATDATKGYRIGRHLAAWPLERLLAEGGEIQPLWRRDDFAALPHAGARIADLNGNGRHEVIGSMIVRHDGSVAASLPVPARHMHHVDAVYVANVLPDRPGLEVVATEERGENRVFLYGVDGVIWSAHHNNEEAQNAAVGKFDPDRPGLQIWARSRHYNDQRPFVFDASGKLIASYQLRQTAPEGWTDRGVETIAPIHWTGDGRQHAAAKERHTAGDVAIFDPLTGRFLLRIPEAAQRLYVADVLGDWREELIVVSETRIRIYSNTRPNPDPGRTSLWDDDHYRQSKIVWNYYNP